MNTSSLKSVEAERLQKIEDLIADHGQDWAEGFDSGSLGCHELLDRANLIADNVEQYLLAHPACVQNPAWYALAEQAATALRELYQRVGAEH